MMNRTSLTAGIALIAALTIVGCAGKVRMAGSSMCQAHGGTYNATSKTCTYTATTLSAKQICESHPGGYWDDAAGFCEVGNP